MKNSCWHTASLARSLAALVPALLSTALLLVSGGAGAQIPVVFKVSEGVRPQSLLSLYGEYLTGSPQVRFLRSDGSVAATQPAVQTDRAGHFCRVVFPSLAPGSYRLAVKNAVGWSGTFFVNRAEPRWVSEERTYPGLPLKLIGRNLDAWEYGGAHSTRIRLVPVNGGAVSGISPNAITPYCVDFTTPLSLAPGDYYLEINAGSAQYGQDWRRLNNHSEYPESLRDTVIRVERAPTSPSALTLRVAWANDFVWTRRVDAKMQFGAKGDGAADDTVPIQKALDYINAQGGGIVFLPLGTYKVSSLTMGNKSILRGASRTGTVVQASRTFGFAVTLSGSVQGLSTLTLRYQSDVATQDDGTLVGGNAEKTFLYNTKFDCFRKPDVSAKQSPYYFNGPGPLLVAGCQFAISSKNQWDHTVRNRVTFRDNYVDMHDGLGLCMSSEKLLVLNNQLVFHPAAYAGQMNGFFLNEGWMGWNIYNAYIAGNNATNLNGPGDCQPYAADSAWSCFAGSVLHSDTMTADVRNDVSAKFGELDDHELELIVVQGKGLGQFRRVTAHQNLGGSPAVVRLTVSSPWDVAPDATSVISVGSFHTNNVFYKNLAYNTKSFYNMYYGGSYDCVDAEAISFSSEGWCNWGRIGEYPDASWHTPVYFSQLKRSRFSGRSPASLTMGLTLRVENETVNYRGVADYGTEIRDNFIDRSACSDTSQRLVGDAAIGARMQNWGETKPDSPLLLATLCEGNTIRNSTVGFDLNRSHAFAIRGTIYQNCPTPVNDNGFETALLSGAPSALALRSPAKSLGQPAAIVQLAANGRHRRVRLARRHSPTKIARAGRQPG